MRILAVRSAVGLGDGAGEALTLAPPHYGVTPWYLAMASRFGVTLQRRAT